jgi:ribokinase
MARHAHVATVGHVESIEFLHVPHLPTAGEVMRSTGWWGEIGGGGAVAAVTLAELAGGAPFLTALGRDTLGGYARARLARLGVDLRVAERSEPTRRAITLVDGGGERTIITIGARLQPQGHDPLPWAEMVGMDAVYFTAGDAAALRAARGARVLVASPRAGDALAAKVEIDALVLSGDDEVECRLAEEHAGVARLVVTTAGADGGSYRARDGTQGSWSAAPAPGPIVDTYGCGDSFSAGLTFALGAGDRLEDALAFAARCGAARLSGRGPYAGELPAP